MYVLAACWDYEGMTVLPYLFTDEQVKEITLENDSRILIDFMDVIFPTFKSFFKSSCDAYMFVKVNAVSNDMADRIKVNTACDRAEEELSEKELSDEITYDEPEETDYLASMDVEIEKEHHRRVRAEKHKAKAKRKAFNAGAFLTKEQKSFAKRMLHKANRKGSENPYYKNRYAFNQILWELT